MNTNIPENILIPPIKEVNIPLGNIFDVKISQLHLNEKDQKKLKAPMQEKPKKFKLRPQNKKNQSNINTNPKDKEDKINLGVVNSKNNIELLTIENFKNKKLQKKQKLCDFTKFEELPSNINPQPTLNPSTLQNQNATPLLLSNTKQSVLIPSLADNYLEIQRKIKNSNPILWLIRSKNRQNQIKDKTIENLKASKQHININQENQIPISTTTNAINTNNNNNNQNNHIINIPLPKLNPLIDSKSITVSKAFKENDTLNEINGHIIHWKKGALVKEGEHSYIYKAFNIDTGNIFIVKEYKIEKSLNKKYYFTEVKTLKLLRHINIVNFCGAEVLKDKFYIYLEMIGGGNIREFIEKYGAFNEVIIKNYIKQIISVLEYMNMQRLMYVNLSLEHLMIECDGILKFVDFSQVRPNKSKVLNKFIEIDNNYDIKSLGKVVKEILEKCERKKNFEYSRGLIEYCDFLSTSEDNLISYREIKNHPFLK